MNTYCATFRGIYMLRTNHFYLERYCFGSIMIDFKIVVVIVFNIPFYVLNHYNITVLTLPSI